MLNEVLCSSLHMLHAGLDSYCNEQYKILSILNKLCECLCFSTLCDKTSLYCLFIYLKFDMIQLLIEWEWSLYKLPQARALYIPMRQICLFNLKFRVQHCKKCVLSCTRWIVSALSHLCNILVTSAEWNSKIKIMNSKIASWTGTRILL